MEMVLILAREVGMLLLLMALGVYTNKKGIFTERTAKRFSTFLVSIVMPILMINTMQRDKIPDMMPGFWATMILGIVILAFSAILCTFIFRPGMEGYKTSRLAVVMPNCGFMGIPLLRVSTGEDTILYCAAFLGIFQLCMWCWAVPMLEGSRPSLRKILINPGVVAFVISLFLFLFDIRLPALLYSFTSQISDINTPLSMIMIGVFLADIRLKDVFTSKAIYKTVFYRNLAIPLATVLIMYILGVSARYGKTFSLAFIILAACSSAASALLLPVRAGESGVFASKAVALSSIFSIVTLPFVVYIAERIL